MQNLLSSTVKEFLKQARSKSISPISIPVKTKISTKEKKVLEQKSKMKKTLQTQNLDTYSLLSILCKEKLLQQDFANLLKSNNHYSHLLCWLCIQKFKNGKKSEKQTYAFSIFNGFLHQNAVNFIQIDSKVAVKYSEMSELADNPTHTLNKQDFDTLEVELHNKLYPFVNQFLS